MNTPIQIEGTIPLRRRGRMEEHGSGALLPNPLSSSRIPRIARLMALALHIEELVRSRALGSYAAAARLGHVSRARMSQILALLNLAPDLQEKLLFLEHPTRGRAAPVLRHVLTMAAGLDWHEQRRRWRRFRRARGQRRSAVS